jgi:TPR repeat protein
LLLKYSIQYTWKDRWFASGLDSRLGAITYVLEGLITCLALGLAAMLSSGRPSIGSLAFLFLGLTVCVCIILADRRGIYWIPIGDGIDVEINDEAVVTQRPGQVSLRHLWREVVSVHDGAEGLLLKFPRSTSGFSLAGPLLLWLPARTFASIAEQGIVLHLARGLATSEPEPPSTSGTLPRSRLSEPPDTVISYRPAVLSNVPAWVRVVGYYLIVFVIRSALHGGAGSDYNTGMRYFKGSTRVPPDYLQASVYLKKAADAGSPEAMNNLAIIYQDGRAPVPRDEVLALNLFEQAAMKGLRSSEINLAFAYDEGRGTPVDYTQALLWYRKAAAQGSARAEAQLGAHYRSSLGVPQDDIEATNWFRRAAAHGDAFGENMLGLQFLNGRGVAKDDGLAAYWFLSSAGLGNAAAQVNLAVAYLNGRGVAKDTSAAMAWLNKAAAQGEPAANKILGELESKGVGIAQSLAQQSLLTGFADSQNANRGADWFRAAAQGVPGAPSARTNHVASNFSTIGAPPAAHKVRQSVPKPSPEIPKSPFSPILTAFVCQCSAQPIETLRDQVGCVDSAVAPSPSRQVFDDLAQRLLTQVDSGGISEGTARHDIYTSLSERDTTNTP